MAIDPVFLDTVIFKPAALTSAGVTDTFIVAENNLVAAQNLVFQVQVSSIGTNVVVRFEGSLDNTDFFNIDSTGDTTITTNGVTAYHSSETPLKSVRCRLVSISGGTPSVTFTIAVQ